MVRFGLLPILFTMGSYFSLAQVVPDTTHINIGDKTIIVIDKDPNAAAQIAAPDTTTPVTKDDKELKLEMTHYAGIDFGYCQLMDATGSLTRDSATSWMSLNSNRSLSWKLNLIEKKIRIHKDYVGLVTGFGIAFNGFGLSKNANLVDDDNFGTLALEVEESSRNYTKNKLRITSLQIPLLVEVNSRKEIRRNVHFSFGAIGGFVTSSVTKQKWENEFGKQTMRRKDDFNVTPLTLDLTIRMGYNKSALFFTYGLTPLFEKNAGKQVFPITFGIQLVQF
jgi:hypothetical protein